MFLYIGFIPNTDFLHNTALKLENGYIIVDSNGETNIEGIPGLISNQSVSNGILTNTVSEIVIYINNASNN